MADAEIVGEMLGMIKWFDPAKGYGFIQINDGKEKKDVFLHVKELRRSGIVALNDGTEVSFTAKKGEKGLFATQVKALPGNTQ